MIIEMSFLHVVVLTLFQYTTILKHYFYENL